MTKKEPKRIEIGSPPCTPRPDHWLEEVLKGTGILPINSEVRSFGDWEYNYENAVDDKLWNDNRDLIYERLSNLYDEGYIRYAYVSSKV